MQTDGQQPRPARDRYVEVFAALKAARNTTYAELARTVRTSPQNVSAAARAMQNGRPHALPTQPLVTDLDRALQASGQLLNAMAPGCHGGHCY